MRRNYKAPVLLHWWFGPWHNSPSIPVFLITGVGSRIPSNESIGEGGRDAGQSVPATTRTAERTFVSAPTAAYHGMITHRE